MKRVNLFNKQNESIVICRIIENHNAISEIAEVLEPDDFFCQQYADFYKKALEYYNLNQIYDVTTLLDKTKFSFVEYSDMAMNAGASVANLSGAVYLVKEYALKRKIQRLTEKAKIDVENNDVFDVIEILQVQLDELTNIKSSNILPAPVLTEKFLAKQNELMNQKNKPLETGINNFDRMFGQFMPGEITIIGARPSIGKTALALSIMWNMINSGLSVGFLSLEMPLYQIMMRFLSISSNISLQDLRMFNDPANIKFFTNKFIEKFRNFKYCLDDTGGLTEIGVKNRIKRMKKLYNVDIVFIDYIGLMKCSIKRENRANEIAHISATLMNTAKELNIPICELVQINREAEKGKHKTPSLSDLRDSGSLEQDASTVILIDRPEFYGIDKFSNGEYTSNKAQLILAKQRNGDTGKKTVCFDKKSAYFWDSSVNTKENYNGTKEELEEVAYLTDDDVEPF